jgi:hypothetical protein
VLLLALLQLANRKIASEGNDTIDEEANSEPLAKKSLLDDINVSDNSGIQIVILLFVLTSLF